jgi:arylsulfatase A-like enzyme
MQRPNGPFFSGRKSSKPTREPMLSTMPRTSFSLSNVSPHQPKKEWIDKFKGKFDKGYERMREEIFTNQKRLGVVPADAQLTPWPDGQDEFGGAKLPRWESLSLIQKKLYARQAEVFAGYVAYTDHEWPGDSAGRRHGQTRQHAHHLHLRRQWDQRRRHRGRHVQPADCLQRHSETPGSVANAALRRVGLGETYPHMAVQWSWAFDTPFKWTKQVASHFGGTRQGMVISWPGHIKDAGGMRSQFHHIIDIVPTILEAAGISAPETVNGIPQKPIEGVSMAYTFEETNAKAPSTHPRQYFEMFCNRGIYHEGWYACTTPFAAPWLMATGKLPDVNDYQWELYDLTHDYSQNNDLKEKNPEKLKELQALFLTEAAKYQVFPLDNTLLRRYMTPRPSATAGKSVLTYTGEKAGIPVDNAPNILNKDYTITAQITVPKGGAEGMIVTLGGRFGGYGLFLQHGKPVFVYNLLDLERFRWEGVVGGIVHQDVFGRELKPGQHTIEFDFKYDGPGPGKGGTGVLSVDGKQLDKKTIKHTIPMMMSIDETFDVGLDTRTGVDHSYELPFKFTGTIDKLTFKLGPSQLSEVEQKTAAHDMAMVHD